jgi:hypothetical protein
MNSPRIRIRLDGNGRVYRPGETLSGEYCLDGILAEDVRAIEISVLWYTEGKGDEDLAVHDFHRISIENGGLDLEHPGRFSTVLPCSPLTYCGVIVRIHWCVRVRVFIAHGRDLLGELEFRLGDVPTVRPQVACSPYTACLPAGGTAVRSPGYYPDTNANHVGRPS